MHAHTQEFLVACEAHSADRLRAVLAAGFDPRTPIDGVSPVTTLVEMYYRSDAFPECLALLLAAGGTLDDAVLKPVLLNDADALRAALAVDPSLVRHRTSLRCAFTPLDGATLLHVAAEYGHVAVAEVLLAHGARPDVAVRGVTWGRGFAWATTCFDVTPVSYAQMGALPQFQRDEVEIATNVRELLVAAGRAVPADLNVPNRYLRGR